MDLPFTSRNRSSHGQDALNIPFDLILSESINRLQELFRRVHFSLDGGDAVSYNAENRLEAVQRGGLDLGLIALYYQFGRYLLITLSRPGSQAANLQGVWNDAVSPPWGSKYTINITTQMNHWPAEAANPPEMVEPLVRLVEDLAYTGAIPAKTMYGARGWVAHHNTDLWRASAPIDGPQFGLWPCGGAW